MITKLIWFSIVFLTFGLYSDAEAKQKYPFKVIITDEQGKLIKKIIDPSDDKPSRLKEEKRGNDTYILLPEDIQNHVKDREIGK